MLYAIKQTAASAVDADQLHAFVRCTAERRRSIDDVYWLKENAELLRILVCTETDIGAGSLGLYEAFYNSAESRMQFFPQYYRFILSICLDLERLGINGPVGRQLQALVRRRRLVEGELSDLQRLEARWLLGGASTPDRPAEDLLHRMRLFGSNAAFFAIPNRKAAFELTHLVFYASDYGRVQPHWLKCVLPALHNIGIVALLDDDKDLLAEVIVSLRYCGAPVPFYWSQVAGGARQSLEGAPHGTHPVGSDLFHEALTLGWAESVNSGLFALPKLDDDSTVFVRPGEHAKPSALHALSVLLWRQGDRRSDCWDAFSARDGAA
ncbi:MAG: hypothetical protein AAF499_14030, partial [Pseudomonadota bacterium]